jgi:hypothetical protein
VRHRNTVRSAIGPFKNRSQLLDEAKLASALSANKTTRTHVPQRKTLDGTADAQ